MGAALPPSGQGNLAASSTNEQPPTANVALELDHWRLVYTESRRAFDFRVQEVQNQQQRIANVLFTNGLLLGFLGATAGVFVSGVPSRLPAYLYLGSIGVLALGLGAGALALWPRITIKGGSQANTASAQQPNRNLFLEARRVQEAGTRTASNLPDGTLQLLKDLTDSIALDTEKSKHVAVMGKRRVFIRAQLICFFGGAVLLVGAFLARLLAS